MKRKIGLFYGLMAAYYGSGGILFPVLSLFLSKKLPMDQVGLLMAIIPLGALAFQLAWGWLADRWDLTKVLIIMLTGSILSALGLLWADSFSRYLIIFWLYAFFNSALGSLIDTLALAENPDQFGRVRLWGTIGFGVTVFFSGVTVGGTMILIHSGLLFITLIFLLLIRIRVGEPNPKTEPVTIKGGLALLAKPALTTLLAFLFIIFLAVKSHETFYAYGLDYLKASGWLIGFTWTFGVIPEIGVFLWIDKLTARSSHHWFLPFGVLMYFIRLGLLGFTDSILIWSLSHLMEALAFCFVYVGAIRTVNEMVPKTYQATGQSLFAMIGNGLGGVVGNGLGGWVVRTWGVFAFYRSLSLLCLLAFVGVILLVKPAERSANPNAER